MATVTWDEKSAEGRVFKKQDKPKQKPSVEEAERKTRADEVSQLLEHPLFKKYIIDEYIVEHSMRTATTFTGGKYDLDTLNAISHLVYHLDTLGEF